jgi:CRP/FNR family transcriptional regulator, nitrogen oxide reductase regulator
MGTSSKGVTGAQIAGMELFLGLSGSTLHEVAAQARLQVLPRGTMLFAQGAPAERCHALLTGRVRIGQSGEEGGQLIVRFVGPGEMFGTVALFTDRHYPAEATTVIDSIEISWTEAELLELLRRHPQIALNLVKIVGARLREAQERLREVATQRVEQRIAHALLRLANCDGSAEGKVAAIDYPLTRQDVAEMCGATLHTASRVLKAWERAGYVSSDRKGVRILDIAEIRRIAGASPPER